MNDLELFTVFMCATLCTVQKLTYSHISLLCEQKEEKMGEQPFFKHHGQLQDLLSVQIAGNSGF